MTEHGPPGSSPEATAHWAAVAERTEARRRRDRERQRRDNLCPHDVPLGPDWDCPQCWQALLVQAAAGDLVGR